MRNNPNNFQSIPNPYIVGKPIEDKHMFFGRMDDFAFISKKVSGAERGGIIVLCGSRRSGKTSILFQIRQGRLGEGFIPVLIDMQAMTVQSDKEFLSKLAVEVVSAVGSHEISFEKDFYEKSGENPYGAFQEFAGKVDSALKGKKLIIMFDEYELFETHIEKGKFSADILNTLANWMEHKRGIFLIFTGSDRLEARRAAFWDRFLSKTIQRRISFITANDTFRLIHEPVQGLIQYNEGISDEVFKLTAGQPFYSQVICQSIIDHLNEEHSYVVTEENLQNVVKYIIENPLPQMIFAWNSLSDHEKFVLSIIAELSKEEVKPVAVDDILEFPKREDIGIILDCNKVHEAAERLFYHDYLEKRDSGKRFVFKMDLWRQWIAHMHSIWQVINELKSKDHELEEGIVFVETQEISSARKRIRRLSAVIISIVVITAAAYYGFIKPKDSRLGNPLIVTRDSTTVSIDTEPSGALVFFGDDIFGKTPIENKGVLACTTSLRVQREGYIEYIDTLELRKGEPADRNYILVEKTGALKISSTPTDARIYLNGESAEFSTPATIGGLSVNKLHRVVLKHDGFTDEIIQSIEIIENDTAAINVELSIHRFPFSVRSTPYGAEIYLNGKFRGTTPYSFNSLKRGKYELKLKKYGYNSEGLDVIIPYPDDRISVELTELLPAKVVLRIIPWADLYVDGGLVKKGTFSETIIFKEGTHFIELRHKIYGTLMDTLRVISARDTIIEYNLKVGKE